MTGTFFRDFIRGSYGVCLIGLVFYGWFSVRPAAIATASTLAAASAGRGINHQLVSRRLNEAIKRQSAENQVMAAQIETLKQALEQNFGWHEKFKAAEAEKERLQRLFDEAKAELADAIARLERFSLANDQWEVESKVWEEKSKARMEPLKSEVERLKKSTEHYQKLYQRATEEYNSMADLNNEQAAKIEFLKLQLQALLAPKRLNGELPEQKLADEIANWFGSANPAIQLNVESASVSGQDWSLLFSMKNSRDKNRIHEFAGWLQNDFSLAETPTIKVIDERVRITIHRGEMNNESRYLKVDPSWLKTALVLSKGGKLETHHARFQGSTECGKSTLVSNAIGCVVSSIPMIEVKLADPLLNGKSEWKTIKPAYKGEDAVVAAIIEFYQEYKAIDEGKAEIGHPKVFILDEFDKLVAKHPELIPFILEIWKSGRHYERYFWIISQSALVGKFGLNMEDMDNLIGFYLGQTLERGFIDSHEDPNYISRLRQEWHTTKAKRLEWVCFVRPHTLKNRPFLAVMPLPGHYSIGGDIHAIAEQVNEEKYLENRSIEFDTGEAVDRLNRLFEMETPENQAASKPEFEVTQKQLKAAKQLLEQGLKPHEIILKVWNRKKGNGKAYQFYKGIVSKLMNSGGSETA